jgi:hypothetical protein
MEIGYYRVFLQSADDADWLVVYVPLDSNGNYGTGPEPHLVKTLWADHYSYGEFKHTGSQHNLIVWDGEAPDSLTEFLTVPVRKDALIRVYEGSTVDYEMYEFTVRDIRRL